MGYPDYFAWDDSYRKTAKLRLRRIGRFKEPPGSLLEIGSATGSFLDAARTFGFRVKGLDLSTTLAKIARTRHGLEIDVDHIEDCNLPSSHFDVVCNWGGIACWRDPLRALSNIHCSLRPNGIFALNYFDSDAFPARILGTRHFEYNHASLIVFAKKTMEQCLVRAGFSVVYSESERQYASLGRIAAYLKLQFVHKALGKLRLKEATIPLIVPGTVFAICRKSNAKIT
jgi:SAM-dependent methyltransferase